MSNTPEWRVWKGMRQRCLDVDVPQYRHYGGRGIKICTRWESFDNFFEDMGHRPSAKHSLDRIDVNGNYEPNNCKWATWKEQHRNRRSNVLIEYNGKIQCMSAWAEEYGLSKCILHYRLTKGKWPIEKALTTPTKR